MSSMKQKDNSTKKNYLPSTSIEWFWLSFERPCNPKLTTLLIAENGFEADTDTLLWGSVIFTLNGLPMKGTQTIFFFFLNTLI